MAEQTITLASFKHEVKPDWCPGCGDFGVLNGVQTALAALGKEPKDVAVISGIGCSSNLPQFIKTFGFHTLHGRSLAVANGVKLANPNLVVIAAGGDGDGYGIGVGHFIHSMRRNIDITYVVMNNQIYGLTTGQVSPTSTLGVKTKTTPGGNLENPINPISLAIAGGATYVARGFSGDTKHLSNLIAAGVQHKGFALIDVFSPCVTYNKMNTFDWFRQRVYKLEDSGHNPSDFGRAMEKSLEWGEKIPTGLFWKSERPALDDVKRGPNYTVPSEWNAPHGIPSKELQEILSEFL